jgi:hypothetical protein
MSEENLAMNWRIAIAFVALTAICAAPAAAECKFTYFGNSTEDKLDAFRRHGACAAQEYIEKHRRALTRPSRNQTG